MLLTLSFKPAALVIAQEQLAALELFLEDAVLLTRYSIVRCCSRFTQPQTVRGKARRGWWSAVMEPFYQAVSHGLKTGCDAAVRVGYCALDKPNLIRI